MAEARQAVGINFSVTQDGQLNLNYDWEVLRLILQVNKTGKDERKSLNIFEKIALI